MSGQVAVVTRRKINPAYALENFLQKNGSTVSDDLTFSGDIIFSGTTTINTPIMVSVDPAITATGTDDTDGYALTKQFNVITGGAANTGVELPTAAVGTVITVANLTSTDKKVYANASDQIDDKTATTGFVVVKAEQVVTFTAYTVALWQSEFEASAVYDTLYVDTIAENTSATGVTIDGVLLKDSQVTTDVINEKTGAAGVTIDSVLLKDNTVLTGVGAVGTPSVQVGSADTGLYQVSGTQTGFSQDGVLVATYDTDGLTADTLRARVDPGTANTGVTAVTYGDGKNFTTVLTVSQADAVTVADAAALADGYLLYTFPAGPIVVSAAYMSMALTLAEDTTATAEVGLGTTIGSGANATLGAVAAAAENIITAQVAADANGTATVKTIADQVLVIEAAGDHTVYFNIADTWADTAGADLTGDIAGTVTLKWTLME